MSAITWFFIGASIGMLLVFALLSLALALSKRMTDEHRKANEATMALLADANARRDDIRTQLARIANELEQQGGRK